MTPRSLTRRGFLASPLAALIPSFGGYEYRFHHDHVMGTSFDLVLHVGSGADARTAHAAIFNEIVRLSKVLSTYDRGSEISRFNARGCTGDCLRDLSQVLDAYEAWSQRTSGAISARIGGMVEAWKQAEKLQRLPEEVPPGRRLRPALQVDALGKAYIADHAVAAALGAAPGIRGLLLNIGGDTGLILIFYLHKHRRWGLLVVAIGTVVCYVVSLVWVP